MNIGLITYHAAYNFGSVLQTYATQQVLKKMGYGVEIINYRPLSQKNFYKLLPQRAGIIGKIVNSALTVPVLKQRIRRRDKYEKSLIELFNLTKEIQEPEECIQFKDKYDVYLSGSDQIWNKNSNELKYVNWRRYMSPYLLEFTDRKKISYASSINNMTDSELELIKDALNRFSHISVREQSSEERLRILLDVETTTVLDPTLLLDMNDWKILIDGWKNKYCKKKYILYYSLFGNREIYKEIKYINRIAKKENLRVVVLAPLSIPWCGHGIINVVDADVFDFLGLIRDAKFIVTSSYHGTIFSVNFNKQFYSIQKFKGSNIRVEEIAEKLGFSNRVIYSLDSIDLKKRIDFAAINSKRNEKRHESLEYLRNSVEK